MQTETQGKVFIVGGSIWLMISAYFLISAFLPNNQTIHSDITTEEEIIITEDISVEEEVDFTQILLDGQWQRTLHVLIPEVLFTLWFDSIAQNIKENIWFDIVFHTPWEAVRRDRNGNRIYDDNIIDIALIPTENIQSLIPYSKVVPIAESLIPYYHPIFEELLDNTTYTFIPHSIDPLLIYTIWDTTIPSNVQTWWDIVTNRNSPQRWHFPILLWFGSQDRHFMRQGRELLENQFLISYHLIRQITQSQNALEDMIDFIDITNNTRGSSRNVADFISTTNRLNEQNRHCRTYPSICLFNYNLGNSRFWFLSDIHTIENYFSIREYQIEPFWFWEDYPARWWWFIVNNQTESTTRVSHFLESYIVASIVEINSWLWDKTIPASMIANSTINDPDVQWWLYSNETNRNIVIGTNNFFQLFKEEVWLIQTREWEQSPEELIQNIQNNNQ